ncbi:MAG TPA: hypothetical protein VE995_01855 [Gaiellaceae bacterium]|nr:hypothetical protein [Gaiellaceae bacterium]
MRLFLAIVGVLALAGSAIAASPAVRELKRSGSGPIEAVAQDGGAVAWLAAGREACNAIYVLERDGRELALPQPSAAAMTCHWDLSQGPSQLAFAARAATALWTLHGSGPAPFDYVLAARVGGPERRLVRLAHASTGTGLWLGGVAGAGRTLAYSFADVEYVDKLACLAGGSCKQRIAGGGIDLVTRGTVTPLPGAGPALELATAAGQLAYVPAETVTKSGEPAASPAAPIEIVDATTGNLVAQVQPRGVPLAIALSPHLLAVLTQRSGRDRVTWYDAADGSRLGSVPVSAQATPQLAASDRLVVFRVGRTLRAIAVATGRKRILARTGASPVGLSLADGRLVWAENRDDGGRIRTLVLGRQG